MSASIVVLTRGLPLHGLGGMEVVAWEISRELARLGAQVRILTTHVPGQSGEFEQDNVTIVPLSEAPAARYSSAWWRGSHKFFKNQCIHDTTAVLSVSAAAFGILSLKSQMPGVPFVMQAHGTSWGEALSKWKSRRVRSVLSSARNLLWLPNDLRAYRQFDRIVAVGERVYQDLASAPSRWAVPPHKRLLINNGIDTHVFRPDSVARARRRAELGIDDMTAVYVSASRLHVQKGVHLGLKAFAALLRRQPNSLYLVAGDGPERRALEQLAASLGIADRVRFLGSMARDILVSWIQSADIFVFLTERIEGLPLNVLEALACGLPAIVSDHLQLFSSPALTLVSPRDSDGAANAMFQAYLTRQSPPASYLPEEYWLSVAAEKYLALLTEAPHVCDTVQSA